MKQKVLLLMVLALGLYSINGKSQTRNRASDTKKITSSTLSKEKESITKTREVGEDGFVWYKLMKDNLLGVQDIEGNIIIPIEYTYISYNCSDGSGTHFFRVSKGDFSGTYTREGKCVVSTDMHYTSVWLYGSKEKIYWKVEKNGGRKGMLDARGNEVISPNRGYTDLYIDYNGCCGTWYIAVSRGDYAGICDMNGVEIITPDKYAECCPHPHKKSQTLKVRYTKNGSWDEIPYQYTGSLISRFDFSSYDDLQYAFKASKASYNSNTSTSSTSSSSSTSNSSTSNSGGGTTTVVVEHHHDPVPVQQWQACFACGGMGTMGCDFCGGGGTKYIGDRLHRCSRCNGRGIIPCNVCYGNKGQYVTVYK